MQLAHGTKLGPYEILSPLGAGGMGEVYRARDSRLGRDVAVKVLPQHLSSNPEVRARFEREAKTVSSLNHPHICVLYDVGREGSTDYLVMELVEGETLATKLARGALPVAEVLKVGGEIADALDRAHRAGVVHRDFKPGNVMLTKSGAKLMDFGLARATGLAGASSSGASGLTQSPTIAQPLTAEGTIVGTFQYMSPEQLEGKEADARSDIWALGCVLYEMATGKRAYEGSTQASLISAIMRDQPRPMAELSPMSPPALERLVLQCLAKDPDDRWQSARDLGRELAFASAAPRAGAGAPASRRLGRAERLVWAVAVVTLAAFGAYLARTREQPPASRVISAILAPPNTDFDTRTLPVAVSPDGRMIVLACEDSTGATSLWLRALDTKESRMLLGTEGASMPFWSPDSRDVAFFANERVMRTSLTGGSPQELGPASNPGGGCWSPGGFVLVSSGATNTLWRIPEEGGEAVVVLDSAQATASYAVWPIVLPGGRYFLFGSQANILVEGAKDGIYAAPLDGSEAPSLIVPEAKNASYVESGQLLFWKNGAVWAQPFDASRRRLSGSPQRIADDVSYNVQFGCGLFSAAPSGELVYLQGSNTELSQLVWFDRTGRELEAATPPGLYYWPRLSHDGRKIAVDLSDAVSNEGDIWIFDVARKLGDRLTSNPLNETCPAWSPDDSRLYWLSSVDAEGTGDIHSRLLRGSGGEETTLRSNDIVRPFDVSPDGRTLLLGRRRADRRGDLDLLQMSLADGKVTPVLDSEHADWTGRWSNDGQWLVYTSDESGRAEIYIRRNPDSGEKWRVSTRGGVAPVWSGDGREVFYAEPDGNIMSVALRTEPTVDLGSPVSLFRAEMAIDGFANCFDVSADGQRFLVNRFVRARAATTLTLDLGWSSPN